MRRIKKLLLSIVLGTLFVSILSYIFDTSFVLKPRRAALRNCHCNQVKDTVQIFQKGIINEDHSWVIYLVLDKYDRQQNSKLGKHHFLRLDDVDIIRKLCARKKKIM